MPSPSKVDDNRLHGNFFEEKDMDAACDAAVSGIVDLIDADKDPEVDYPYIGSNLAGSYCGFGHHEWPGDSRELYFELGFQKLDPDRVGDIGESNNEQGKRLDECDVLKPRGEPDGTVKELSGHKFCSVKDFNAPESEVSVGQFTTRATIVGVRILMYDDKDYDAKAIRDAALTEVFDTLPK